MRTVVGLLCIVLCASSMWNPERLTLVLLSFLEISAPTCLLFRIDGDHR